MGAAKRYSLPPMSFLKLSTVFLPLSAVLVLASLVILVVPGPKLGIEFTGGTLMELELPEGKTREDLMMSLRSFEEDKATFESASVTPTQSGTLFVRTPSLSNEQHLALVGHLNESIGAVMELQYTTIGPTVGASLKQRAFWALFAALIAIVIYVALAFRKIPKSMSPWTFGLAAIVALVHDIIIMLGIFTILSYTTTFQVDTLFVSALLSIMGYSVSDTIVIFDRIRDNLTDGSSRREDFATIADQSLKQSLSRTLNTGLGALIMLFALFFFGSESIRWFILALILGTVIGTYSSFFVATPLLAIWRRWR